MLQVYHVLCFHSLDSTKLRLWCYIYLTDVTLILSPHLSESQILHFSLEDVIKKKNGNVQGVSVADPMFHLWFLYKIIANVLVGFSVSNWCFIGPYCVKTLKTLMKCRYNLPALSMTFVSYHTSVCLCFILHLFSREVCACIHVCACVSVCVHPPSAWYKAIEHHCSQNPIKNTSANHIVALGDMFRCYHEHTLFI